MAVVVRTAAVHFQARIHPRLIVLPRIWDAMLLKILLPPGIASEVEVQVAYAIGISTASFNQCQDLWYS